MSVIAAPYVVTTTEGANSIYRERWGTAVVASRYTEDVDTSGRCG